MGCCRLFLGIVEILKEALQVFPKNGKLMLSITLLTLLLKSFLCLSIFFSIRPLTKDLIRNLLLLNPNSPEFAYILISLKRDLGLIIGLEWIWVLVTFIVSLVLVTITIFASAITHGRAGDHDITFKTLLSIALKSWKRPLITWFYTTLLGLGYNFLMLAILLPPALLIESRVALYAARIALIILALLFYVYISVVWSLSFVVSVLEEVSGIEALGNAARIIKGMKTKGFFLNLFFFTILSIVFGLGISFGGTSRSITAQLIIGLVVVNCLSFVGMLMCVAYTIFYFHCKKTHEEIVQLPEGNVEYSKLPPEIGENFP